ncbi:MAG: DUF3341 domain-containing protein [Thermoanaerobaculum sp.]
MSRRLFVAYFDQEKKLLNAVTALRRAGFGVVDVFSPYPVHGLEEALGWRRSRLPYVTFALGVLGAAFKVWFEFWTTGVSWPLNVGGKPFNSLPAFVPVTFEVMVLLAGVSTVLAFLLVTRSFPGKKAHLLNARLTNDLFAVVLEQVDARFDPADVRAVLAPFAPVQVEERVEGGEEP